MASSQKAYRVLQLVFAWGRDVLLERQREEIENLRMRAEDDDIQALPFSTVAIRAASVASLQLQREEIEGRKMDLEERKTREWNYCERWDAMAAAARVYSPATPKTEPRPHMLGFD